MKFNIYINQYKLIENKDVSIQEAAVIDWLYTMFGSTNEKMTKKRVEGWTWVSLPYLIEDMPLLRIKTNSGAAKLVRKIKSMGFITTRVDTKERKLYAKPTQKMRDLYFSNPIKDRVRKDTSQVLEDTSRVPQDTNHNTNIILLDTIPSIGSANTPHAEEKKALFSFIEELNKLKEGGVRTKADGTQTEPRKDLKIIALYWSVKGLTFENKEQMNAALKGELRAAKELIGYSGSQIRQALEYCQKSYPDFPWRLATARKVIADIINKK